MIFSRLLLTDRGRVTCSCLTLSLVALCGASCAGALTSSQQDSQRHSAVMAENSLPESGYDPEDGDRAVADAVSQHLQGSLQALADEYGRAVDGGTARFSICTTQFDHERDMEVTDCSIVGNEPLEGDRAYEQESEAAGESVD